MRLAHVIAVVVAAAACGPEPIPVAPGGGSPVDPVAGGAPSAGDPGSPSTPDPTEPDPTTPDPTPSTPDTPDPTPPAPAAEKGVPKHLAGILAAHNAVRAKHCAPSLTWSAELARVAQRWADHLASSGCGFGHSGGKYGENLAAGSPGALTNEGVVRMWYDEIDKYSFQKPGFSMETGHFTQVVWLDTRRVGCGTSTCNGFQLWVCNYDPPGNVHTMYEKNVLPTSCR